MITGELLIINGIRKSFNLDYPDLFIYINTTFMIARIFAPAKINIHLEILSKRDDGFHDLLSIFQSVSLGDTIVVETMLSGGITVSGNFPFPGNRNIMHRAATLFLEAAGIHSGISINTEKLIPIGAGLGGGSSDAASVIACLASLFPGSVPEQTITEILQKLGSDVPYFYTGTAAIVSGRGDIVEPVSPRTDFHIVIVYPGFGIGTGQAYAALDRLREEKCSLNNATIGKEELLSCYFSDDTVRFRFFNSFREIAENQYPEIARILNLFNETGIFYSSITGSGSAMFGLYKKSDQAMKAYNFFRENSLPVFLAKPLDKRPLPVLQ